MVFAFVVVIREGPLMYIPNAFTMEYYLSILEFLVENLSKHRTLVEGLSFPMMVRVEV